ncbi:MAG TPA: SLC13 family permease, partial [Arenibaculum sp.]|nr:SLC13 family permease [Arenibaculum sp.]
VLGGLVTVLSAFMKNIGALAIFIPVAIQVARRTGKPHSRVLMPMAFGSLLGGVVTMIGTTPNIVVARMRADLLGEPFRMFDFAPVGIGLALAGMAFLTVGWRLLPERGRRDAGREALFAVENYMTEVSLPADSPYVGRTVYDLETLGEGDVTVAAIIREQVRRYVPSGHWVLFADDVLVLECDTPALDRLIAAAGLKLLGEPENAPSGMRRADEDEPSTIEAVITSDSPLVGNSAEELRLRERYGASLLALSRRGQRVSQRLRRVRFQPGDLVILQMRGGGIAETLTEIGCLPLAGRDIRLGRRTSGIVPIGVLAVALALITAGIVPVAVGFFAAAIAMVVLGQLDIRNAYDAIDWPLLILLGALIPVSEALSSTGATDLIAEWLARAASLMPAYGALALLLFTAMAVTPFLNNAATVLVMAPIGAGLAGRLGLSPDPFLMAVAVGAACDFLTPIGHQCNTLVMGPGGYRFSDYWRLGLPLSLIVLVLGTALISLVWPLVPN